MAHAPAVREGIQRLLYACEAVRIVRLAEEAGVTVVLFKGAALAEIAYGGSEHRHSSDIDLLVKTEDFGSLDRLLAAQGYLPRRPLPAWLLQKPGWGAPTLPYAMHYQNVNANSEVDLHTGLLPNDHSAALNLPRIWQRLDQVEICGRAVPTLGTIDMLLFLALHGTRHQWDGERYIRDFCAFARARITPDIWRLALAEAQERGCRDTLLVAVRFGKERLGFDFPEEICQMARCSPRAGRIAAWYSRRAVNGAGPTYSTFGVFQCGWRMWDTLQQRMLWLLRLVITPNLFDFGWVRLPEMLGVLYYFVRPVRLVWQWAVRPIVTRFRS